ncbi:glycosyltransferase family 39 protein [Carboxylicivirga sediminis]|uniref:Glycosyltransferase family 39 protein n=1 Tax=Carboxylicivirga sediminis TaxID=2006564 RepID=A0A941F5K5_9BACT|nr:glycosyltransferase family 39 protein [Carboxylicivirga sediminis]MBR8536872.1 glycosyltransferase family 39 protein [Carboxylicivirga sediminis]
MKRKDTLLLLLLVLAKFILQYALIDATYDLHRDEFLHLDQANHLAWGYHSVPPLTSWLSWVIKLLGNGVFWVKFFPALFGALTLVVVWRSIGYLGGDLRAKLLGGFGVLFSVLLRLNTLYQPNSFDILSWTLVFYCLIRYLKDEQARYLYALAVALALGFLNKYNMVFLMLGLLPALLLSGQRTLFLRKELYLAGGLALVLVMPNLIWQYQNGFPVIHHMNELAATQLVNVKRFTFLSTQPLFFTGSLFVMLAGLWALWFYQPFSKLRSLFWTMIIVLSLYTWLKAKDYYAIGLYPIYIALGAVYVSSWLRQRWGQVVYVLLLASPVVYFAYTYDVLYPNKTPEYIVANHNRYQEMGVLRWEDGKDHELPQDFADMLGWHELAQKLDSVYASLDNPSSTLVLCDNYGQAGAVNFYGREGIRAASFNADYVNWFELDQPYTQLIRVITASAVKEEFAETAQYFNVAYVADSIANPFAREFGTSICVFQGTAVNINAIIKQEVEERQLSRQW